MQLGISSHVLLQQRLHPTHLDAFAAAGARHIELFAARNHFDYTDRNAVKEIAAWFRSSEIKPSLHQPTDAESRWTRHSAPTLNLVAPDKFRRIEAQDEIKRALETAEQIPFTTLTLHLGLNHDAWDDTILEHCLTTVEHLKAFAGPLGVKLLIENLYNDVATPAHLMSILKIGHFDSVNIAFDLGHAHLAPNQPLDGIEPALKLIKPRIGALHLHDNDANTDQHLWPLTMEKGGIDWAKVLPQLPTNVPAIVEIAHDPPLDIDTIVTKFTATFDTIRSLEDAASA
ncbi:Sugar phosphate isomerase/epimerase [Granulicella pectinivorans]|uniref:Sugar phosphate isomerase/epimerase n=1 Tax=Granulicella pectinivorans TaxID=474950 RepID=A0A1I6M0D4_9BACT|nr:sugar phosphate isomerase/epimerase [Granulicella pectinivorans]SFS09157.1 Sugar phosphate isomerase/epimerase [Granulicella pectinivorans]